MASLSTLQHINPFRKRRLKQRHSFPNGSRPQLHNIRMRHVLQILLHLEELLSWLFVS